MNIYANYPGKMRNKGFILITAIWVTTTLAVFTISLLFLLEIAYERQRSEKIVKEKQAEALIRTGLYRTIFELKESLSSETPIVDVDLLNMKEKINNELGLSYKVESLIDEESKISINKGSYVLPCVLSKEECSLIGEALKLKESITNNGTKYWYRPDIDFEYEIGPMPATNVDSDKHYGIFIKKPQGYMKIETIEEIAQIMGIDAAELSNIKRRCTIEETSGVNINTVDKYMLQALMNWQMHASLGVPDGEKDLYPRFRGAYYDQADDVIKERPYRTNEISQELMIFRPQFFSEQFANSASPSSVWYTASGYMGGGENTTPTDTILTIEGPSIYTAHSFHYNIEVSSKSGSLSKKIEYTIKLFPNKFPCIIKCSH